MIAAVQYAVIAAAGLVAIGTIAVMIVPNLRRIADVLSGQSVVCRSTGTDDRWRRVHIDSDRRKPFSKIRAASPRRGLLGRRSPH
ncbi:MULTISPECIES: hypothetical protein [Sphingomonas]|uniref:hypothetical protein n=1 Tax=Sphingomonas TaxID=13687 RepID=UPI00254F91F6|nr:MULTISPECIES: hypothetical protein [Sphingomonas]MDK8187743.1 hypothetical protein [Sphingomonas zeae]MDK8217598.1 hypothetical protein [Sphingomonas sp. UMB7805-LC452B]